LTRCGLKASDLPCPRPVRPPAVADDLHARRCPPICSRVVPAAGTRSPSPFSSS